MRIVGEYHLAADYLLSNWRRLVIQFSNFDENVNPFNFPSTMNERLEVTYVVFGLDGSKVVPTADVLGAMVDNNLWTPSAYDLLNLAVQRDPVFLMQVAESSGLVALCSSPWRNGKGYKTPAFFYFEGYTNIGLRDFDSDWGPKRLFLGVRFGK